MTTTALKYQSALQHTTVFTAVARTWATIALWRERARQRMQLTELSPEMLKDLGISISAARAEAIKPFWVA